jgi:hypothetical protein
MTKDEMTSLLNIAGVAPSMVDAMTQAYEMGFEHGGRAGSKMRDLVMEATAICHDIDADRDTDTAPFWDIYNQLKDVE